MSRVLDLGCGKGATAVAVAQACGCRVEGIDLFEPFIEHSRHLLSQLALLTTVPSARAIS